MKTQRSLRPSCSVGQCYLPENEAERIRAVFGLYGEAALPSVNGYTLRIYHDYLAAHLSFPFTALYAESKPPLRQLVRYASVLGLQDLSGRPSQGILCKIDGASLVRELPLVEIGVRDDDPNYWLIDDYASWFSHLGRVTDWLTPSMVRSQKGTMANGLLAANWQLYLSSVRCLAESVAYEAFPELAERAKREAEQFGQLPPPKDPTEMAQMMTQSSIMQSSWNSEFLSRTAMQANAEMLASTKEVIADLWHRSPAL
jgi:hypothetical protein